MNMKSKKIKAVGAATLAAATLSTSGVLASADASNANSTMPPAISAAFPFEKQFVEVAGPNLAYVDEGGSLSLRVRSLESISGGR